MNKCYKLSHYFGILLLTISQQLAAENLKDVNRWLNKLDENNQQQAFVKEVGSFAFGSLETKPALPLETPKASINDRHFQEEYEKMTRINRQNLIDGLEKRFKIYLINYKRHGNRHRTHINILERKLVAKGRHGGNRYEFRISHEKYRAKYAFSF